MSNKFKGNIYYIKVILTDWARHVRGMPYRTIAIPESYTLYNFAEKIIESYNFDFDHAFGFYDNIKRWTESDEGYTPFVDDRKNYKNYGGVKTTKISKVYNFPKKKMLFLFDYGDEWLFVTQLLKVEKSKENIEYPVIVGSFGNSPSQYGDYYEEDYGECEDENDKDLVTDVSNNQENLDEDIKIVFVDNIEEEIYKCIEDNLKNGTLELTIDNLHFYSKYLNNKINFPVGAIYRDSTDLFGEVTNRINIIRIKESGLNRINVLKRGLICICESRLNKIEIPLSEIETAESGLNSELIEQYKQWFLKKIC